MHCIFNEILHYILCIKIFAVVGFVTVIIYAVN